jgi:hypothetical protein
VYAGAERLGQQTIAPSGTPQSILENLDPVTGDGTKHLSNGSFFGMTTLDADGIDVGVSDPFPPDGSGAENGGLGQLTKPVPFITPIEGGGAKCILDGLEIECSRISGNSSVQCPNNDCNTTLRLVGSSQGHVVATWIVPAPVGWDPSYDGTYVFNDGLPWRRRRGNPPTRRIGDTPSSPQNTQPDIQGIRNGLQQALKRWECRELIQNLLDAVKSKKNPVAKNGVIMDLFEAVVKQGRITRIPPAGSAGFGNPIGKIKNNNAAIFSAVKFNNPSLQLLADIQTTLHELLHLAGYNHYYTDEEFARAVHNNQEYRSRSPYPPDEPALHDELKDPGALGWGAYWNDVLMQKCFQ